ncbi:hypothetical protein TRFO_06609 [Tritrichomonas foetus]|uniref:BAR domain-containing protein n=1 Tax=Tritrichomonas foetus TaxID=1144522 RepID=A0A1J4JX83_9EUKA|nr:hypothetical protein TRFO_06609 [Tritrichomonas foetus]|eukprot:OHT03761.1 hypothetical protein TRFO_06609 [Tritrichomonas foetus]
MKCQSYLQSFSAIRKAKESNVLLLETIVQSTREYTGSIDQFLLTLSKIPNDLPEKRQKRLFKSVLGPLDFEGKEPETDKIWNNFSGNFISKPPSILILNDSLKRHFIDQLSDLLQTYAESMNKIESDFQSSYSVYAAEENNYNKSNKAYQFICEQIEDLHTKLKPENTSNKSPDIIDKLRSDFTECKNQYKTIQTEALLATESFDAANSEFSVNSEKILCEFEKVDKMFMENLHNIFVQFVQYTGNSLKSMYGENNLIVDALLPLENIKESTEADPKIDEQTPISTAINPRGLDIDFTELIDPSVLFEPELSQKTAIIASENASLPGEYVFPKGTAVRVIEIRGNEAKVIDEEGKRAARVNTAYLTMDDLQRGSPNDWKLATLKEDIGGDNPSGISGKKGQSVLAGKIEGVSAQCMDMYGRKGMVPLEKLSF